MSYILFGKKSEFPGEGQNYINEEPIVLTEKGERSRLLPIITES